MRQAAETTSFNLVILDIAMPGEDGLSLGRWLRSRMPVGIIYATAAGTSIDRIVGLELGADDYMVKPYELREMLARVRSVLRRVPSPDEMPVHKAAGDEPARRAVSFGEFSVDLDGRVLTGAERQCDRNGQERVRRARSLPDRARTACSPAPPFPRRSACARSRKPRAPSTSASCGCARRSRPTRPIHAICGQCEAKDIFSRCPRTCTKVSTDPGTRIDAGRRHPKSRTARRWRQHRRGRCG